MTKISYRLRLFVICALVACSTGAQADPIHEAAMDGDAERVKQLLDQGADANAPDDAGTPLEWALFGNQITAARILLEHGADPNVEGPTGTPLTQAALFGNIEMINLLLKHGGDPNIGDRLTPLIAASQKGNLETTELLLEHGADPTFSSFEGVTALHKAAEGGRLEIVKRLVEHGADVNAITSVGKPPIHFAVFHNHVELAIYLREQGAAPGPIAPITDMLGTADLAEGELEAQACAACHKFEKDKKDFGPSLWNVVGNPRASAENFDYSPAFAALEGVWTYEALNEFLARPSEVIPGNRMALFGKSGVPDPQKRANLIAFLRTLSDDPEPLP